jgi:hypothetical protein
MFYDYLTIRISSRMRAELRAHVAKIDSDPSKFARELIARALSIARDAEREMQHHMLFCALALDYLLGAHPDADLRKLVIEDYKETVKDWERPHVD